MALEFRKLVKHDTAETKISPTQFYLPARRSVYANSLLFHTLLDPIVAFIQYGPNLVLSFGQQKSHVHFQRMCCWESIRSDNRIVSTTKIHFSNAFDTFFSIQIIRSSWVHILKIASRFCCFAYGRAHTDHNQKQKKKQLSHPNDDAVCLSSIFGRPPSDEVLLPERELSFSVDVKFFLLKFVTISVNSMNWELNPVFRQCPLRSSLSKLNCPLHTKTACGIAAARNVNQTHTPSLRS